MPEPRITAKTVTLAGAGSFQCPGPQPCPLLLFTVLLTQVSECHPGAQSPPNLAGVCSWRRLLHFEPPFVACPSTSIALGIFPYEFSLWPQDLPWPAGNGHL